MTKLFLVTGPNELGRAYLVNALKEQLPKKTRTVNAEAVRRFMGSAKDTHTEILDLIDICDLVSRSSKYVIVDWECYDSEFVQKLHADKVLLVTAYVPTPTKWKLLPHDYHFSLPIDYYDLDKFARQLRA